MKFFTYVAVEFFLLRDEPFNLALELIDLYVEAVDALLKMQRNQRSRGITPSYVNFQ